MPQLDSFVVKENLTKTFDFSLSLNITNFGSHTAGQYIISVPLPLL